MALFLIVKAIPSLQANQANFLTSTEFLTSDSDNLRFGVRDLFMVTVLSSVFALAIAVPIAIGIAAFLTNYAPSRLAKPFAMLVDLLAAVPSIVFGLWGHLRARSLAHPPGGDTAQRESRLVLPVLGRQRVAGRRRNDLHRGHRAGGDDPADHHVGHPRGVRAHPRADTSRRRRHSAPPSGKSSG